MALACLLLPFILLSRKKWVMRVFQLILLGGAAIWIERTFVLIQVRQQYQMPWLRLSIILATVALFTLLSALVFFNKKIVAIFKKGAPEAVRPAITASLVTAGILIFVHFKVKVPVMLLMERFLPGAGGVEILLLALYAGWITEKVMDPAKTPAVRAKIWLLFSIVFFTQLILGAAGIEKLLMTGKLHLPVPAMIIAGPLFRGGGFFMLILFASTVVLLGSAWCSYLCYIGAWDNLAARGKATPKVLPKWRHAARMGIFAMIVVTAILLRMAGVPGLAATLAGAMFGLVGVGIMVLVSRKLGSMSHCVVYCPIGLAANLLGKLNPFRIRISNTCTDCGACRLACRYDALNKEDIEKRRPGLTCTLCGDCITRCHEDSIHYKFPGLSPGAARIVFIVTAISLHAVFLGVARL
jgi:polyferredoxin